MATIELPKFDNSRCLMITSCGELTSAKPALVKRLKKHESLEGRYRASGQSGHVHVGFGDKSGKHFHVDLALHEWMERVGVPEKRAPIADVRQAMSLVIGEHVEAAIRGLYFLPNSELPSFIEKARTSCQIGDAKLRNAAGEVFVEGSPVTRIKWFAGDTDDEACVILEGRIETTIDEVYLKDCLELMDQSFSTFILESDDDN